MVGVPLVSIAAAAAEAARVELAGTGIRSHY